MMSPMLSLGTMMNAFTIGSAMCSITDGSGICIGLSIMSTSPSVFVTS